MKISTILLVSFILSIPSVALAGPWTATLKEYQCLEIEKFTVDREDFSSHETERAATIPDETLSRLQHKVVGEVIRAKIVGEVTKADAKPCEGRALVLGGKVTDYKEGDRAARMFIGWGSGKQKFEVQCYIKDKQSGNVLVKKQVVDRKVGGIAGGDEAKGESDFAEKVASFVKNGK